MASLTHALSFYQTTIGKKAVMAISGVALFGFVVMHMIGNLQVFLGPQKLDAYARFLHSNPGLLWVLRSVLLVALAAHVLSAVTLFVINRRARPQRYRKQAPQASTVSSRTMIYGGVAIFSFVLYHLMHLTWGNALAGFIPGAVYCNVVRGFQVWPAATAYIAAQLFLGLHLYHGVWSMFQTLGWISPSWEVRWRRLGIATALLISLGNISMPAAVAAGVLPHANVSMTEVCVAGGAR